MTYKVKLELFEGPLDLLLYLIKKDDIDISDIPIAKITEQYMEYIGIMQQLDLEIVGDFLVMAATLVQIKTKMLLPPDPSEVTSEAIDPRDELAQRLLEYQRFKEVADDLKTREEYRRDLFARSMSEEEQRRLRDDAKEVFFEANLFDLINALTDALNKAPQEIIHEIIKEEFTVEQKIHEVLHRLLDHDRIQLKDLFRIARSRTEMIVTFLAILELIRLKEVKIIQQSVFGDIEVLRNKDNITPVSEEEPKEEQTPS